MKYYHYTGKDYIPEIIDSNGFILYWIWHDHTKYTKPEQVTRSDPFRTRREECKEITKEQIEELLFLDYL